jgi:hypothetical protein
MTPSRALSRPFDECLSFLLVLRVVVLTLAALVTVSVLILSHPQANEPRPRTISVQLLSSDEPALRHEEHRYTGFPSAAEQVEPHAAGTGSGFDARLPHDTLKPRPIRP